MPKIATGHLLSRIRELFLTSHLNSPIHAYIVLSNDCHMSEYTSESDKRRQFISGFDGSAGSVVITNSEALLWTDSRYFLQAESCLDENWKLMKSGLPGTPTMLEWLKKMPKNSIIGTDPNFITYTQWEQLRKGLSKSGNSLVPIKENLVDIVWKEHGWKPDLLSKPYIYDLKFSGLTWQRKLQITREKMLAKNCDLLILSALDEIAWLYNLRGSDIHCSPVFKSFSLITPTSATLFIDKDRITPEIDIHLNSILMGTDIHVSIQPYLGVVSALKDLETISSCVWISDTTPAFLALEIPEDKFIFETNPVCEQKAVKNEVELKNLRLACTRDAACLCEFFGYLEKNIRVSSIDEYQAASHLFSIRSKMENFVMNSFDCISSTGPNAAIVHYDPDEKNSALIKKDQIYLCDSGGNYLDGTTDITRTLHFGTPTQHERECYTLVLKGHISLASAIFPKGSRGSQIDSFARQHLWRSGLNFLHGTGHGIGMFLNVHEGPQRISSSASSDPAFEIGNVLSNEPGYYEDGKFGIRIENMMTVVPVSPKYNFNNTGFFGFETISFIPMEMNLIDVSMLDSHEIVWLNNYHRQCLERIMPELEKFNFSDGIDYLLKNTCQINIK